MDRSLILLFLSRFFAVYMDTVGVVGYIISWLLAIVFLKAGLVKICHLFPSEHQQAVGAFLYLHVNGFLK